MNAFFIFVTVASGLGLVGDSVRGAVTIRFANGDLCYSYSICSTADEFSREVALTLAEDNRQFWIQRVPNPDTLPKGARGFVWASIRETISKDMATRFATDRDLFMRLVRKIYPTPSLRMNRLGPETVVRIEPYIPPRPSAPGAILEGQRTFRERKYSYLLKEGVITKPVGPQKPRRVWSADQIEAARNSKLNGN